MKHAWTALWLTLFVGPLLSCYTPPQTRVAEPEPVVTPIMVDGKVVGWVHHLPVCGGVVCSTEMD